MKRRVLVVAPVVVVVLAVVAVLVLKEDQPADCTLPADEVAALQKSGLALTSTRKLGEVAARVDAHLAAQADRLAVFRRYDVALCASAQRALTDAREATKQAQETRAKAEAISTTGTAALAEARQAVDNTIAWVSAGILSDDVVAKASRTRAALTEAEAQHTRAKSELSALGYEGNLDGLERAASTVAGRREEAKGLAAEARAEGLRRCVAKVKGGPLDADRVLAFKDWLVVHAGQSTVAFFALEGEPRRCVFLRAVTGETTKSRLPGTAAGETLLEWFIPGVIQAKVLVGWSKEEAWFVTRDGAFRSFRHLANVRAVLEEDGCGKPRIAPKELEASCRARAAGDDVARTMQVRYAWDGHGVIAEQ